MKGVIETNEKKTGKYRLPRTVYNMTVWLIRDYVRMLDQPEFYADKIKAVEDAQDVVPKEYMQGVWQNITIHTPFPNDAHRATYARHKSRYIHKVATLAAFLPNVATSEYLYKIENMSQ